MSLFPGPPPDPPPDTGDRHLAVLDAQREIAALVGRGFALDGREVADVLYRVWWAGRGSAAT